MSFQEDFSRAVRAVIENLGDGSFRRLCQGTASIWVSRKDAMSETVDEDSFVLIYGTLDEANQVVHQRDSLDLVIYEDLRQIFDFGGSNEELDGDEEDTHGDDEPLPPYDRKHAIQLLEEVLLSMDDTANHLREKYSSLE